MQAEHIPTEAQIAYFAGLFEGEGCVSVARGGTYGQSRVSIDMTDREPLQRVADLLKMGRIYGPYQKADPNRKPMYSWAVYGWAAVEHIYGLIGDQLSPRRRAQFERAITQAPPPELRGCGAYQRQKTHCPNGHPYSAENTQRRPNGHRMCVTCKREQLRAHRARRRKEGAE